jgi:hypothetical protein
MFYAKSDASINDGFELVSHPFSEAWLRENCEKLDKFFELMQDYDMSAGVNNNQGNCGMHVHMSKAPLSKTEVFKLTGMIILNRNDVVEISERIDQSHINEYCNFPSNLVLTDYKKFAKTKWNAEKLHHHRVVHFTDHTLEVRVFDGVSEYPKFMKNMEFLFSLKSFVKETRAKDCSFKNYHSYVMESSEYSHLKEFLPTKALELKEDYDTSMPNVADTNRVADLVARLNDGQFINDALRAIAIGSEVCCGSGCNNTSRRVCENMGISLSHLRETGEVIGIQ